MELLQQIKEIGIVPVIKIDDLKDAVPLAKALCKGGLPVAEITFRTELAKEAMALISKEVPSMLVGAGTVLTETQVDDAIDAGAKFIVSPGLNPKIVKYCQEKKIAILPGCANASDIEQAIELGLTTVKFFPAELLGGVKMIKALAAPYTKMTFMPTGGVNGNNVNDYLGYEKIVACGGTWMIDAKAMAQGDYDRIETLTKEAVQSMLGLNLMHVAVNASDDTSKEVADKFATLFGGQVRETSKGYFGSELVEVINTDYAMGEHGHMAIGTYHVSRARRYFESLGFSFDETTAQYDEKGQLKFIYLNEEINGFRLHLVKR